MDIPYTLGAARKKGGPFSWKAVAVENVTVSAIQVSGHEKKWPSERMTQKLRGSGKVPPSSRKLVSSSNCNYRTFTNATKKREKSNLPARGVGVRGGGGGK